MGNFFEQMKPAPIPAAPGSNPPAKRRPLRGNGTAAARARRARGRRKAGVIMIAIEIDAALVEDLISAGLLPAWSGNDRAAIAVAVARFLAVARHA
jgi:hypothetical protein